MKIDEIISEWGIDGKVDVINIERELARIGELHAKYMRLYITENITARKIAVQVGKMRYLRRDYYTGDLAKEDYDIYGWEPMARHFTKARAEEALLADPILIAMNLEKIDHEEMAEFAKGVIKEINNRSWQLKSIIDLRKFEAGN